MKTKFIFILGILKLSVFQLKAQHALNYRVTYKLTFKLDSTDLVSSKSEIMWLFANKESSLFLSKGLALKDSINKTFDKSMIGSDRWKAKYESTRTEFDYPIFKNKATNKVGHGFKIVTDNLYYAEDLDQLNWEIKTDSKSIAGYTAQKAITSFAGREFTAWFTPEIPISDGPYKFVGLPGLILELQDTEADYVFSFAGFEELATAIDYQIMPENYKESKKKELLDLVEI